MASYNEETKSSAEIEREIERDRARLSGTVDEIQSKLSPGQIVDQLMGASGAQDFAANMGKSITANPLPVALLGVSVLWLMSGRSNPVAGIMPKNDHGHSHSHGGNGNAHHSPYYDDVGVSGNASGSGGSNGLHNVLDGAKSALSSAGEMASGLVNKATGLAHGAQSQFGSARDGISQVAGQAGQAFGDARSQLNRTAHDVRDGMSGMGTYVSGAQQSAMTMLRDQPLIAGALAFAAGVALGAAFPVTAKEKELIGDAAREAKDAVVGAAQPLMEQGKEMLDKAMEQGKQILDTAVDEGKEVVAEAQGKLVEGYDKLKKDTGLAAGGGSESGAGTQSGQTASTSSSSTAGSQSTGPGTSYR